MKKYLYSFVFATLILMSTTVVNASNEVYYINNENVEMTEKEYNNLLNLGFTEKYIAGIDQEEFLSNKDLEGTVLQETKKYIRTTTTMRNGIKITTREEITEEEAMQDKELQSQKNLNRGPAGNYYDGISMTATTIVTTKIIGISNSYMRFMNNTEWLSIPTDRYYDVIGIGLESSKFHISSSLGFKEEWVTGNGTHANTKVCTPSSTSTGGFAIFELPSGSLQSLEATFYYNVAKNSGVGTITSLYATGDYAHATSNVTPSSLMSHVSVNYSTGILITSPYSYDYVCMSPATASFIGTW